MSLDLLDGVDLDNLTPDDVESGGAFEVIPPGKYAAKLVGATAREAKSGSSGVELEFEILAGPSKGKKVEDTLWKSDKDRGKSRVVLFYHRLGLLEKVGEKGKERYVPVVGKSSPSDVLGAVVVIDVIVEESDSTKNPGKKFKANRLEFQGIFKPDDPKAGDAGRLAREYLAGAGAGTGASTPAAPKADPFKGI